jgi:hypothetical protein
MEPRPFDHRSYMFETRVDIGLVFFEGPLGVVIVDSYVVIDISACLSL